MNKLQQEIQTFNRKTITQCLEARGELQQELFALSTQEKENIFGNRVWFRGIIEFSNMCKNNCYYCGIRKSHKQKRFTMSLEEVVHSLEFIDQAHYGSVVYQSGELTTDTFRDYLLKIVRMTHKKYPKMGITLSCGELDYAFLRKLKQAGATRYLLRIESSNKKLYEKIHPKEMSWDNRYLSLKNLQKLGYQVGTGVMIGLPGQTIDNMIEDLKFFIDNKFDMFGIGPYVIHENTPLGEDPVIQKWWRENKDKNFNIFLNFLAILRILAPNVNIAAATACDVFDPLGRIKVLQIAGNIIMPSVTPQDYRGLYLLYQGKPCIDENADQCLNCITNKIINAGLRPMFDELGNSPFYYAKSITNQSQK